MTDPVRYEVADGIATVTIDRPEQRNALSVAAANRLRELWDEIDRDANVRVAILTSADCGTFCAGLDLREAAALEGQITVNRANRLKCKLVLEGANGPTLPEADDVMKERGILVVPDVICNAGGVTVSYFEWVQDFSSFFWSEDEINLRLDKIMVDALKKIWDTADRHKVSLRTATFAVACERILIAREERGLYP